MRNHSNENEFDLHEDEPVDGTHFHISGFALRLVSTRHGGKRELGNGLLLVPCVFLFFLLYPTSYQPYLVGVSVWLEISETLEIPKEVHKLYPKISVFFGTVLSYLP